MTHHSDSTRVPDVPARAVHYRTGPRPDGSTVLTLLTVAEPYVLHAHSFELDRYLARFLLHTLARDLDGIPDPGRRPEATALFTALDSGDPAAFTAAMDAYGTYLNRLLANGGETA
ncbi:hypothetical protein [Streptomyces sp. NBC_00391]|uniref:hypothetical protein n=1 Tax=Streptomyces sp. NBC_00391 TaxID=2903647 RepID=UPI002E21BC0C